MKILVACEFSQIVTKAFRDRGHEVYSCDLLPTEGNPAWHIQDDVLKHLDDGWDLMIAHPPCQYLSFAGNVWIHQPGRIEKREIAMGFFMKLFNAPINKICIENPPGYPYRAFRKPDQIIHPYNFGHSVRKKTCFWLKNLSPLIPTTPEIQEPPPIRHDGKRNRHWVDCVVGSKNKAKNRSRTFQGIAQAMANTWE